MDIKGLKAEFLLRRGSREEFWITEEIGGVVLALIDAEIARQTVTNLCSHCQWGCMGACPQTDNIVFGCGLGNDNVVECENYINRIAYTRYQAHQTVTDDKVRNEIERNNECIKWLKGTKVTGSKRCVFFMQRCNKLLQLMQTEPWIPVSERLPDHNNPVLINVPDYNLNDGKYLGYITIGGYQNGTWYQGSVGYPGAVTHWQPLPEPPKECHD